MTIKEWYKWMESDYEEILCRLGTEERIKKFLAMLQRDPNFDELEAAFAKEDYITAFQAAHTLKGVLLNLGIKKLAKTSSDLTEALRDGANLDDGKLLLEKLQVDYKAAMDALAEMLKDS